MSDDNCLDVAVPGGPVNLIRCHGMGGNQAWVYDEDVRSALLLTFLLAFSRWLDTRTSSVTRFMHRMVQNIII